MSTTDTGDPTGEGPRVAFFRPDDGRATMAADLLRSLGADPVPDPLLAVSETGGYPRRDADYLVLTSPTGADIIEKGEWEPNEATVCAIGQATADALEAIGLPVDVVPEEYSSDGLVSRLEHEVDGARVEIARSDHGSDRLIDGLEAAGAYVHETVLYELVRPQGAGTSTMLAAEGDLDAALFTSSLTVQHFLEAAEDRGIAEATVDGLAESVVGVIGEPTRETARQAGLTVDVVPARADFAMLARDVMEQIQTESNG